MKNYHESKINNPEFWIKKLEEPEKIILNTDRIKEMNKKMFSEINDMTLKKYIFEINDDSSGYFKGLTLRNFANLNIPAKFCFKKNGKKIKKFNFNDLMDNCNLDKKLIFKKGITKKRINLRRFPTEFINAEFWNSIHQDFFQETVLSPFESFLILQESKDEKWFYIQSNIYPGWIRKKHIELIDNFIEYEHLLNPESFLRVVGDYVQTEPNIYVDSGKIIKFQMGDKIPLTKNNHQPYTQYSLNSFKVPMPVGPKSGKNIVFIKNDNKVSVGNIPFNRKNIVLQSFKLLGERYGWGGSNNRRDCSRFVFDIFRCFGIDLPRDCSIQEKISPFKKIQFDNKNDKYKGKILNTMSSGDLLFLKGHVMIYLNKIGENHYVIHNGSGFSYNGKNFNVHGVMIMPLSMSLLKQKTTYTEALTSVLLLC
ncbi:MAG: hypothetical protein PWQ77_1374 [Kosmotogales bacterium]|nr:hypothetical protein [Kosmotogales bacterium]